MRTTSPRPRLTAKKPRRTAPAIASAPIRVVQFGDEGFPAGVADWRVECIDACRKLGLCAHWPRLVAAFRAPELRFVISSTAGVDFAYVPEPVAHGVCPRSFAAKAAALLYQRFVAVHADPSRGLVFLPCEAVDRNGDTLRQAVLEHAQNWALPGTFANWVREANTFANTRFERGETGARWHIEAPAERCAELPLTRAGVAVTWAPPSVG